MLKCGKKKTKLLVQFYSGTLSESDLKILFGICSKQEIEEFSKEQPDNERKEPDRHYKRNFNSVEEQNLGMNIFEYYHSRLDDLLTPKQMQIYKQILLEQRSVN